MLLLRISDCCLKLFGARSGFCLPKSLKLWLAAGLLVTTLGGCAWMPTCSVICRDTLVKQGQEAFIKEDYTQARRIFHDLSQETADPELRTAGCYGLVCLDMVLAENAQAFRRAASRFFLLPSQLTFQAPFFGFQEPGARENRVEPEFPVLDPLMLSRAMAHGMVLLESERESILEKLNTLFAREKVYKKERCSMHKAIEELKQEIAGLNAMVLSGQKEISALKHQITTLESIDKERQEQRNNQ